jgi:hypothetical protein
MDSYSEVRRVRKEMSDAAGHDLRKLASIYNEGRSAAAARIVDPGTAAERTGFSSAQGAECVK